MAATAKCGKCGKNLIADVDHCRSSHKGGDIVAGPAQVYRCPICGWRHYPEVQPVMPLSPAITGKYQQQDRGPHISEQIYQTVRKFYPDIKWLRSSNTPWLTIANLIKQATGRPIKADTVIKYYEMIQQEGQIHGV